MGFYGEQIVPRVTDVMLGSKAFRPVREEACNGLTGDVIEIGFGSGLNLRFLPPAVTGVWAVDPSGTARKLAAKRIAETPVPVETAGLDGARIDAPDGRFDGALSTMTLCTIPNVTGALSELRRVLKSGAVFHFAEHGHAPDAKVARTQERMNGFQNHVAGGCNLNRPIDDLIEAAGFENVKARNFYLKGPKAWGYMYVGTATNP